MNDERILAAVESKRDIALATHCFVHRHPELAFKEERTASVLGDALATIRPASVKRVAGTGIVARVADRVQVPAGSTYRRMVLVRPKSEDSMIVWPLDAV